MDTNEFVELKIPAKAEYVGVVRLLMSGLAHRLGFPYDDIEDIKIAVAEAVTNATIHAYKDSEGQIIVSCTSYVDRLEVMVIDYGDSSHMEGMQNGLHPISTDASIDKLDEGGLGLFLINTLMDKVEISNDAGVVIVMTKYKKRDEVESDDQSFSTTPS